jgi:hypothetical protein
MILYNPTVSGSLLVTGSLTTTGTITSQTLVVQTITSSIEFNTGSTRNGTLLTNTHEFTGSVLVTGSVGIGTNSPSAPLHTEVSSSTWVSKIINTNTSSNSAGLLIKAGVNSGNEILLAQKANGTSVFLVDASGNVGIGTTSPGEKLGVFGNILINTNSTASSGEIDKIVFGKAHTAGGGYAYSISEIRSFTSNGYAGGLNFYTGRSIGGGAYDAVFAMKVNELGNVLIGTSTDNGYKLNVSGSIYGSSFITINGQINNLGTGDQTYTQTVWYVDTGNQILFENGRTTNSPSGTGRTVYFTWRGGPSVGGGVQLQHGANAWAAYTSDARMKTKVADITNGLETINKLNPIKFKWTRELENSRTVTGFTAQNIEEAIPDAVFNSWHDDELGDVKSYYQDYLVPYLVKSIQELSTKNTALEEILQRNNIQ